jgi:hypothetical protein
MVAIPPHFKTQIKRKRGVAPGTGLDASFVWITTELGRLVAGLLGEVTAGDFQGDTAAERDSYG